MPVPKRSPSSKPRLSQPTNIQYNEQETTIIKALIKLAELSEFVDIIEMNR